MGDYKGYVYDEGRVISRKRKKKSLSPCSVTSSQGSGGRRYSCERSDYSGSGSSDSLVPVRKRRCWESQKPSKSKLRREVYRPQTTKGHERKDKKVKKREKHKKKNHIKGVATYTWGKYGTLHEADFYNKKQEFQLWLMEVKDKSIEALTNWEQKQLFKDYMEDYNTCTFPHKKYYNLEAYERKKALKKQTQSKSALAEFDFNDEERRKSEIKGIRQQRAADSLKKEYASMKEDFDKVDAMRRSRDLHQKMEDLFKAGNFAEAQKLQRLLKPDI